MDKVQNIIEELKNIDLSNFSDYSKYSVEELKNVIATCDANVSKFVLYTNEEIDTFLDCKNKAIYLLEKNG